MEAPTENKDRPTGMEVRGPEPELTGDDLIAMELNAEGVSGCFRVKRVPGGWIYSRMFEGTGIHSLFVPEPSKPRASKK